MKRMLRKFIFVMLVVSMLTASFLSVSYADDLKIAEIIGDVNNDSKINAADALVVLKHAAKIEFINENVFLSADVDGNTNVDAADALEILKYAAGIIDIFPVEQEIVVTSEPSVTPTEESTALPTQIPSILPPILPTDSGEIKMTDDFSGTVWIMGDSIAAHHEKTASVRPLYGWGELIGEYFEDGIRFRNHGISSQSTSSYYNLCKTTYDYVFNLMKENDYVIISFGHNDHNSAKLNDFDRTTDPESGSDVYNSYKWWLKNYYIDPALEKGAVPILMSSVVRYSYDSSDTFVESDVHMKYGVAMEELIEEYNAKGIKIYYIDAQDYTYNLYSSLKPEEARLFHGQYGTEAMNFFDNTHYSEAGARMVIEYMLDEMKQAGLSLMQFCKEQ